MATWNFLTNHGRVLLCIARDPGARLRDIAAELAITERRSQGIIKDLVEAGYVEKSKTGRRNSYEIRGHLPLPEMADRDHAIGDLLDLLART
ncbi:MAG: helix-turn-helix transcriptional regulator [Acidimicrobiales bacterium]